MPEPVSTFGVCYVAGLTALNVYARGRTAVSGEAKTVERAATELVESVERSEALFGQKAVAISKLRALANECSERNWDGNESLALNPFAVCIAESFLRALPDSIPLPEFAPEPDGAISLDWIESRHRLFTLSIGPTNRLAFALLDGSDKGHGVALFDGQTIPPRLVEGILSILNHGNTTLRAA